MKSPRAAAIRLGVLLAVVVAIIALVVQAIERPVDGDTTTYEADFGDVFGLQSSADVRLRGVQVGKVTSIELTEDGNRAIVRFTLLTEHRLRENDQVAVKFQNLTGQRYLAVNQGEQDSPFVPSSQMVTNTLDSFDITTVFNGMRPLMNEADPAVYNQLASNLVSMIEGNQGDMAPVLRDIAKLASYADDRTAVLSTIFDNLQALSGRLQGRSENLENILQVFHSIFMPVASRMDEFLSLMDKGSIEMSEVVRTIDAVSLLFLGARDSQDDLTRRIDEVIPDATEAVRSLSVLPGVLDSVNALIPSSDPAKTCSAGGVSMPVMADVLLAGRQLTICKGS